MNFTPIAHIRSPYKQKFAIPRQPNLVPEATGVIEFEAAFSDPNCLREIEQFSHLWLLFAFHATAAGGWSPMVQPPRLGGKARVGVFASRSTFRPNPIGMSVVKLLDWQQEGSRLRLNVSGIDLLDGTPILDIKPYLPYADSISDARGGYADTVPDCPFPVMFTDEARMGLACHVAEYPHLEAMISSVLSQDPRPAWRRKEADEKRYGMSLYDLNIKWRIDNGCCLVLSIELMPAIDNNQKPLPSRQ